MKGKQVIPLEEQLKKSQAALDAKKDRDLLLLPALMRDKR
jgi:2-methylisocitrate lyase-like PEP mutase family enzyme